VSKGVPCGLLFVKGEPADILPKMWKVLDIGCFGFDDSEEMEMHARAVDRKVLELARGHIRSVGQHAQPLQVCIENSHWLHTPEQYDHILRQNSKGMLCSTNPELVTLNP
jgi:hypothetical protein